MITAKVNYKRTGIRWIPEVPEHWRMWKVSRAFKTIGSGTTPQSGNLNFYNNGTINWVCTGDLNDDLIKTSEHRVTKAAFEKHTALKLFPKGTLLIAMYGATIGKTGILNFDACTNQACCALGESDVILNKFAYYWFIVNKPNIVRLSYGGGQPNISQDVIKQLRIQTPPINEQEKIIEALDTQSAKINRFIRTKQRFIELLKEQRQSIITNAVTKGINDKVKMKETVLGEIPEHWEVRRLKFIADVRFSTVDKHSHKEEKAVKLCNYVDVYKNEYITNDFDFMVATATDAEIKRFTVEKGDVIITKDSETAADIAISALVVEDLENVVCGYHLAHIKPKRKLVESEFLFRLFQSKKINSHFEVAAKGVTRHGLSYDDINSVFLPYPSTLKEQQEIIKNIQTETKTLDIAISKAEREIELIKEYREAMIAEAVTGKMKLN